MGRGPADGAWHRSITNWLDRSWLEDCPAKSAILIPVVVAGRRTAVPVTVAFHQYVDFPEELVAPLLPPLRERREDIAQLVWFFIHRRQRALHRNITKVPAAVMAALESYVWPGNVRELQNVIERALIRSRGESLQLDDSLRVQAESMLPVGNGETIEEVERAHILRVLTAAEWKINGPGHAAERLNMHPNTLRFRMKKLGIVRPRPAG